MSVVAALRNLLRRSRRSRPLPKAKPSLRTPTFEVLEDRDLMYAASGNKWPNSRVTISFMPDGTSLGGATSNLFATFNAKFGSAATWQNQILKAAQYWAQQTNLNFTVVPDNGAASGSGSYQQGDPGFGDIRIGGYNFGNTTLALAYMPPPINNYSIAGDIRFNTSRTFNIGGTYDLFTVALHEIGHATGLLHSTSSSATMYGTYNGIDKALSSDDINGIKYIYSGGAVRASDVYDATASNDATLSATNITSLINATTKAAVINQMDLTTYKDVDVYKIVIPLGSSSTLKASVQSQTLSLLDPKVEILDSTGNVKATATAAKYGAKITASYAGVIPGEIYYVKVSSADAVSAFRTGKYALIVNLGTGTDPKPALPSTRLANGSPLSSGGGQAITFGATTLVNSTITDHQQTSDRAVAAAPSGDYVVTWTSQSQDGDGWGVYAQRYDHNGKKKGGEFRVNSTTAGDQRAPMVAMDSSGFVIAWSSTAPGASGSDIYAQRYSSSGAARGGEFRVNTTTVGDQTEPSAAIDEDGNIVIAWSSWSHDGGWDVYSQRYGNSGAPLGGESRVNSTLAGDQTDSSIVMNRSNGEAIVVWTSSEQDGSGSGIYAQRLSAAGSPLGGEFRVNTNTAGDQADSSIAINRRSGDFVVTWTSAGQDGSGQGIFAQRFHANGSAQGSELLVNSNTAGDQVDSSIAVDSGGNMLVIWSSDGGQSGWQVRAQQITATGLKQEAEFVVTGNDKTEQVSASVAKDMQGRAIVVWAAQGVYAQRYRTDVELFGVDDESDHHHGDREEGNPSVAHLIGVGALGDLNRAPMTHSGAVFAESAAYSKASPVRLPQVSSLAFSPRAWRSATDQIFADEDLPLWLASDLELLHFDGGVL